ncbi:Ni/Fe-hydrogenase, b-type cytochrome subunit [Rhodobacter maris]|uniref:Probable Ni/Fe-hydrogenase B-type cytochrome subunit n=1 Tax=Rhodobacter maris TaxID=446682 RepID=A0A285RHB8_9RHOB|nr:Ni/Fe-hydrogenase, b-type cytochrome subunit [Rhodobacter maris]SOB93480.1 Ni/Fe-hydrogenase 1 B-type cytochrome subunit [Rhodobacter maris]
MRKITDERIYEPRVPPEEIFEASRLTGDATLEDLESIRRRTSVYVYEAPVRIWHWVNALCITILCITGYLIGAPLPSMDYSEATNQFVMGYIRFAHFGAGTVLSIGFLARIYWAFVGNRHAWQMFYIPIFNLRYYREFLFELRWYLFLEEEPKKYVGHNPLAHAAMFFFITLGITFMMITGWALYGEGAGQGSLPDTLFGWVLGIAQNSQRIHTLHHLGMWAIVIFAIIHIYAAVREDVMSRQSMVSTMISGFRTFKDDRIE